MDYELFLKVWFVFLCVHSVMFIYMIYLRWRMDKRIALVTASVVAAREQLQYCSQLQKENDEVIAALDKLRLLYVERTRELEKRRGFSVIELLIVVAILGILASLFSGVHERAVCVGGYKHSLDYRSNYHQILDEQWYGIKCDGPNSN